MRSCGGAAGRVTILAERHGTPGPLSTFSLGSECCSADHQSSRSPHLLAPAGSEGPQCGHCCRSQAHHTNQNNRSKVALPGGKPTTAAQHAHQGTAAEAVFRRCAAGNGAIDPGLGESRLTAVQHRGCSEHGKPDVQLYELPTRETDADSTDRSPVPPSAKHHTPCKRTRYRGRFLARVS